MSANRTHPIGGVDVLASDPLLSPVIAGETGRILLLGGPLCRTPEGPNDGSVGWCVGSLDSFLPTGGRSVVHLLAEPCGRLSSG